MNPLHYGDWVCQKYRLESAMSDEFFIRNSRELASAFKARQVECRLICWRGQRRAELSFRLAW